MLGRPPSLRRVDELEGSVAVEGAGVVGDVPKGRFQLGGEGSRACHAIGQMLEDLNPQGVGEGSDQPLVDDV